MNIVPTFKKKCILQTSLEKGQLYLTNEWRSRTEENVSMNWILKQTNSKES